MRLVVNHGNTLFCHCFKSRSKSRQTVGDRDVMLDVFIAVVVRGQLIRVFSTKHIANKSGNDTACFFLINVFLFKRSVNLGMTGRIRLCNILKIIPVLVDFAIGIEMEHVKRDLLTCSGEIVNSLKENMVSILKSADVVDSGLNGSLLKTCNSGHECVCTGTESEIVLLILRCEKRLSLLQIAGNECANQSQCLFFVCHGGILLKNL